MTVVDRLRSALPGAGAADAAADSAPSWGPGWRRSGLIGVATGLVSALVVVVPVVLAGGADPVDGAGTTDAVRVGAALWFLAGGAQLGAGSATISLTPLLATALLLLLARLGAREAMVQVSTEGEYWGGLLPRALAAAVGAWWAGYAVVVGIAWILAAAGPFPPRPLSVLAPGVALPLLALWLALRPIGRDDPDVLGPRLTPRLPDTLRRGAGAGVAGAALLVGVGLVLVLGTVALAWPQVQAVDADLGATSTGAVVLDGLQVAVLPNLAVWAVSFLAGPGFSVVEGASVSWGGVESGMLPLVPVLGALPQPGAFPLAVGVVSVLVVVACGVWVGRRAVATVARLSRLRTKLAVAASACASAALLVGLLDAVGGGSLGQFRLASVGAPALYLSLALFALLLVGAVGYVLRDAWRLRR
ncbi:DUF6350 family protein [uncultured Phycicoccus sp.]|uniref:cell division protein PerM n=1 Tax=uncultured Phycicoccus sp. TaxID=661422 RepID=UPI00262B28F3|nr:DUF6350 family protein [uncultured Phycicoccus sp.]